MNDSSNLRFLDDARIKNKSRAPRWYSTFGIYTAIKLLLLFCTLGVAAFGFMPYVLAASNKVATIWLIAFILMFLVWALEFKIRKTYYVRVNRM